MILEIHGTLARTCLFYVGAMGLWATWLALRGRGLDGSFLGAVIIGEGLLVVEGALGAWLHLAGGLALERWVHVLYGLLAVLLWPFVLTFRHAASGRREAVAFAAATFFLWLLVRRAVETAHLAPL